MAKIDFFINIPNQDRAAKMETQPVLLILEHFY